MTIPLNVLILEDRPADAALMVHELRRAGFDLVWRRVETEADYVAHLQPGLDVILADYSLPQFDALRALQLLQERGEQTPFIIVSGNIGEELAVAAMKQGAADYLLKDRLARLGPAVARAIHDADERTARRRAEEEVARQAVALRRANAELQQAQVALERRVEERTAALHQEIAERQRLEREAQRAQHFALLGRLAAGVSHEIRNPLGAVFLHVDLLEEELRQPSPDSAATIAETLAEIKANLARLNDLVQDYLSLVRVGSVQCEVQDLGPAVQAWGAEMQQEMAGRGVTLQVQSLAGLGLVAFHASSLQRALLNLVQNAAEAMPQGGTITLTGEDMATHVQLHVQDTGYGIPAERLEHIFEPLYTTKPGGTGLGLYIVQEIVAAHAGQITVQSTEGHGTTFTIALPRPISTPSGRLSGAADMEQ